MFLHEITRFNDETLRITCYNFHCLHFRFDKQVFQVLQRFLRYVEGIGEMFTIRQDQTVLQHVHLHDIVHIDDKPLADAGEKHIMSGQARFQGLEHLRQVHAHLALQLVG